MPGADAKAQLHADILKAVDAYWKTAFTPEPFRPGVTPVRASGKVFDSAEIRSLVDSALEFWLTSGRYTDAFERALADTMGRKHAFFVNSGSSANLLALSALTADALGERRLRPGDEVITVAAGFPTTVNPILQNGLVPVYVDITLPEYNIDPSLLEGALSERTRAVFVAHTLGNPFPVAEVAAFAKKHGLWLIEDCCDALGSRYDGRSVGTFGDAATLSFYPAHQITTGEGGAVLADDPVLKKLYESFRDWGRDCWCPTGKDNTCGKRFGWQLGGLPEGYDHKYTYSNVGYNLKATDLQAAVGVEQIQKLPGFVEKRRTNFKRLHEGLRDLEHVLLLPRATERSEPSWFGFPLAVKPEAPFTRRKLIDHLESRKIVTRLVFGGNLTRQPAYAHKSGRIAGGLTRTDLAMERAFWVGVWPGLGAAEIDYTIEILHQAARELR